MVFIVPQCLVRTLTLTVIVHITLRGATVLAGVVGLSLRVVVLVSAFALAVSVRVAHIEATILAGVVDACECCGRQDQAQQCGECSGHAFSLPPVQRGRQAV